MNSTKFESGIHSNSTSLETRNTQEEDTLSTHTIASERITSALGKEVIPIEDFPEKSAAKELLFTKEDQDIHHTAATKFIAGMLELRKRVDDKEVTPTESQAEEARLKNQYMEDIKSMSKLEDSL